jgi:hypothetical protein
MKKTFRREGWTNTSRSFALQKSERAKIRSRAKAAILNPFVFSCATTPKHNRTAGYLPITLNLDLPMESVLDGLRLKKIFESGNEEPSSREGHLFLSSCVPDYIF